MLRALACALVLSVPLAAGAQTPRSISVQGEALIYVAPDEAVIEFGITTLAPDPAEAQRANDRRVAGALDALRQAGLDDEALQSDRLSIQPEYERPVIAANRRITGYRAARSVQVTLSDLDAFEATVQTVLAAGIDRFGGASFRTTALRAHRDSARAMALEAAREKATAMARQLDQAIGTPLSITEGTPRSPFARAGSIQNVVTTAGDLSGGAGPTVIGRIPVSASVSVTFELADP
ncbi:MAG: SIMPL domain-containing protein [Bacteroidota bacterium]